MKLYLVNHDQRYAAEQMLLTLFPEERPEYPHAPTDGDCAVLTLSRGAQNATVTCRLRRDGKTALGRAAVPIAALTDDQTEGRLISRAVKRAFYHAAWGALYRKEFLVKNNLLFPVGQKKAQDAVFNTEAYFHAERIAYLPYIMYYYRGNPQGITRRYSADLPQIYEALLKLLLADKQAFYPDDAQVDASFRNHRIMAIVIDNMRLNIFHKDNPLSKEQRKKDFLAFIEQEPYRSAIESFDPKASDRWEWLLTVKLLQKKNFSLLNLFAGNDVLFNKLSGAYKRLKKR